jgi:hypothetical protein
MATQKIGSRVAIITQKVIGQISSVFGYAIAGFGLLGLLFEILNEDREVYGLGLALFLIIVGTLFILNGMRIRNRIHRFKHYVSVISGLKITNLDSLAAQIGRPVIFVKNDLQRMINKKFFRNASIDTINGEIIIPGIQGMSQNPAASIENYICSRCGASGIREVGSTPICEYCGSVTR